MQVSTLSDEEECWCRSLVNGSPGARIPAGESMGEITGHMFAALEHCRSLPAGSIPLLVSHGIGLGALLNRILGIPTYAERRLRLRNCSISKVELSGDALFSQWLGIRNSRGYCSFNLSPH